MDRLLLLKNASAVRFVVPEMREASSRFDSFQPLVGRVFKRNSKTVSKYINA